MGGLGFKDTVMGAMYAGMHPAEAIKVCSKYSLAFNDHITEYKIKTK